MDASGWDASRCNNVDRRGGSRKQTLKLVYCPAGFGRRGGGCLWVLAVHRGVITSQHVGEGLALICCGKIYMYLSTWTRYTPSPLVYAPTYGSTIGSVFSDTCGQYMCS